MTCASAIIYKFLASFKSALTFKEVRNNAITLALKGGSKR